MTRAVGVVALGTRLVAVPVGDVTVAPRDESEDDEESDGNRSEGPRWHDQRGEFLGLGQNLEKAACVVLGIGGGGALQLVGLGLSILLAIACATLVVTDRAPRLVFRLIIAAAVVDVVLLALAGPRLIV